MNYGGYRTRTRSKHRREIIWADGTWNSLGLAWRKFPWPGLAPLSRTTSFTSPVLLQHAPSQKGSVFRVPVPCPAKRVPVL
eukprot:scaffold321862_cov36-Prasinocladus_malaysianus.AAC.2